MRSEGKGRRITAIPGWNPSTQAVAATAETTTTKAASPSKSAAAGRVPFLAAPAAKKGTEAGLDSGAGRGELTATGEVVGGFGDFLPGADLVTLSLGPSVALAPAKVLNEWRPLVDALPMWRSQLARSPELRDVFVLDCGAGGDCLFHVLAAGLNQLLQAPVHRMEDMRKVAADQAARLGAAAADEFLIDLHGQLPAHMRNWLPEDKAHHLATIVRKTGGYWGETGTLRQLFLKAGAFAERKLGFAVLNIRRKPTAFRPITDNETAAYIGAKRKPPREVACKWEPVVETTILRLKDTEYLLFMHCVDNSHWVLLGYAPGSSQVKNSEPGARIASSFPIRSFPKPLHPFIQE